MSPKASAARWDPHLEVRLRTGGENLVCWGSLGEEVKCHMRAGVPDHTASRLPREPGSQTKAFTSSYFPWALGPTLSLPVKAQVCVGSGALGGEPAGGGPRKPIQPSGRPGCCGL